MAGRLYHDARACARMSVCSGSSGIVRQLLPALRFREGDP